MAWIFPYCNWARAPTFSAICYWKLSVSIKGTSISNYSPLDQNFLQFMTVAMNRIQLHGFVIFL